MTAFPIVLESTIGISTCAKVVLNIMVSLLFK